MRTFKDLQGNEFKLYNCIELEEGVVMGFVVGNGMTKIFSTIFEL